MADYYGIGSGQGFLAGLGGFGGLNQQATQGRLCSESNARMLQMQAQTITTSTTGGTIRITEEKTIIQELQEETDEWLKDI